MVISGLTMGYRHHHNTRVMVGWLWGLSFLPPKVIPAAFQYIMRNKKGDVYDGLLVYFQEQWFNGAFPIERWSVYREEKRTNNSLEGMFKKQAEFLVIL